MLFRSGIQGPAGPAGSAGSATSCFAPTAPVITNPTEASIQYAFTKTGGAGTLSFGTPTYRGDARGGSVRVPFIITGGSSVTGTLRFSTYGAAIPIARFKETSDVNAFIDIYPTTGSPSGSVTRTWTGYQIADAFITFYYWNLE